MSQGEGLGRRIVAGHCRRPGRGHEIAGQNSENGALARTVRAEQPNHFTFGNGKRYVPHRETRTVPLDQVLHVNDRRPHRGPFRCSVPIVPSHLGDSMFARRHIRSSIAAAFPSLSVGFYAATGYRLRRGNDKFKLACGPVNPALRGQACTHTVRVIKKQKQVAEAPPPVRRPDAESQRVTRSTPGNACAA